MINKIRKYQDSWLTKGILFLTALSFMSLFGVSGYIGSAGKNKPAIKVDSMELLQNDLMIQYNKQLEMAKSMFGDNMEDNVRAMIMQQVISKNLSDMVVLRTAKKLNMYISDELIRNTVQSRAEFMNDYGHFDLNKMRRTLLMYGMSEGDYISQLKREIEKQHLIYTSVENFEVPAIMAEYVAKAQNMKKEFKYIKLDTAKTKIDRKISQEEVEQYYEDFILEFTNPETRDADFIFISNEDAVKTVSPSQEEIDAYYKEHIERFETPEQRRVLQMVFDSEEMALTAKKELDNGKDFIAAAKEFASQTADETDFGLVSKDMLIEEISDVAFSSAKNKNSQPIQSDLGWHIIKITEINQATKMSYAKAKEDIIEEIRKEQAFEIMQSLSREIDDKAGSGMSLKELAKDMNLNIYTAYGLTEDGKAKKIPSRFKDLPSNVEFIDSIFSYNVEEVSQIIETNDGILLTSVTAVTEAQPKDIKEVRGEIEKMWAENERSETVQEIISNVMSDLEQGETIEDIASRFSLTYKKTKPLKRDETFEELNSNTIMQLFQQPYNSPKILDLENIKLIIVSEKVKASKDELTKQEINTAKARLKLNTIREYSDYLINSFAKDCKITVDYKVIGLSE
ncbi:MAG: peptidyl-prolyl cis-trans isomerase [Lactobacillaceae bacterium]|jgi:peptidyl-prolyl cis-trans isomerase D|nr:peptidyl-prolyl cis-trans isomerase [Lactobacillaceae bacterium]